MATALFVTVLLPVSSAAIYLLTVRANEPHLVALALGERAMEEVLHTRRYVSETRRLDDGRWTVQTAIDQRNTQLVIRVRVFRRKRPAPLVELMTVRVLD